MLEIEKAEGIYLFDKKGKKYIDLISGINVSSAGHRHPRVVEAIYNQIDKYMHVMVYGEYVQAPQVKLAKALSLTLPEKLSVAYFVNSGSEAVEGALKIAKRYTGRQEIISCYNAYHGSSQGALSVCGNEEFKRAYRPLLPQISFIQHGSKSDLRMITDKTAAVIIETVQGEAGIRMADSDYFQELRDRCTHYGTLLILDEIQTGFGRTGKIWGFEHYNIVPDILVAAKGMGGGMPLGAFISSPDLMSVIRKNPILGHITTFGGHPISSAASLATLQVIQEEKLAERADSKALLFKQNLKHPAIKEIRNKGLMMALEFSDFQRLKKIIDLSIEKGVITDWFLYCNNSMRIAPPLTISESQIKEACHIILDAISKSEK